MKAFPYILLSVILQLMCAVSFSQRKNIKFDHIGIEEGLSQSFVTCIFQDSKGYMWFGTADGLNKYDGYKFTVYKNKEGDKHSISNNQINGISEDRNGNLWLATWNGINMFDRKKEKFTHYKRKDNEPAGISSNSINGIISDRQGNLWIAADRSDVNDKNGLNFFDFKNQKFKNIIFNRDDTVNSEDYDVVVVFEDSQKNLWVGTSNAGLNLFDRKNNTFINFSHHESDSNSLSGNAVKTIFEDSRHNLWIGTRDAGLNLFDAKSKTFRHFRKNEINNNCLPSDNILSLGEDNFGNLWVGTNNGGLSIYNLPTGIFNNYGHNNNDPSGINNNSVYSIYKDQKGNMWLGTFSGGINFFSADGSKFTHFRQNISVNSLNNNTIFCIRENSKGDIMLATDGGGLNIYHPQTSSFSFYKHEAGNKNSICGDHVLSVLEDSEHFLWVGTWGDGVTMIDPAKKIFRHFKYNANDPSGISGNNAWTIYEDRAKNIWIGTYWGGVSVYNRKTGKFSIYKNIPGNPASINSNVINSIFEDSKGNMWIGTMHGGLDLLDRKTNKFTHFVHHVEKNSISDNTVTTIFEDSKGHVWLGTANGLNLLNAEEKKFTSFMVKDGLPHNYIRGILEDEKGKLWISTNGGLSCFNIETKKFKNFTASDGLQSPEFKTHAAVKSHTGEMYFGGINGFNKFFPDSIKDISFDPPVQITEFLIFNEPLAIADSLHPRSPLKMNISETKEITLSYKESVISFEFASLNYTSEKKKQYSYKLEGFDKGWNEVGTRHSATYTNLDPGTYIFKVRGLNNEGKWSPVETAIQLTITPPFWQTWWFKLSVLVFILGSAIAFFKFRIRAIKVQKINLQRKVHEQTKQLLQSAEEEHNARNEADKARLETEQAYKELEGKNKELEQFAYVASHDMQEPLRTTSSFVELLQQQYSGILDERGEKYLHFIAQSSDRMKVLIHDLLEYSRIGRKKEIKQVDCNQMLNEVLADLNAAISDAGAEIISQPLPVVYGYPTEIKQLFQNLIINAIKFTQKNVLPQIKISIEKTNGYWQFSFSDNGIGIEEKYNERIFIIFQRLHNRNEYEGSGIGLSHCKKIVEMHKGKIWVKSTTGNGSTFYFTIPVASSPTLARMAR